jgi:hypothetical protein
VRRVLCAIWLVCAAACVLPTVKPKRPAPPAPPYSLRVFVLTAQGIAIPGAQAYRDNDAGRLLPTAIDGSVVFGPLEASNFSFNVCGQADGYHSTCAPVGLEGKAAGVVHVALPLEPKAEPPQPPQAPSAPAWTRAQLTDLQGDLMLYAPEVGCAPEARIYCDAAGIRAGWVWTISIPRFSEAHRAALIARAKALGWTHYPVQVTACRVESGYHDLYPVTAEDCALEPQRTNAALQEVRAAGLIPVCTGVGPLDPVLPGLDRSLCPIALDDWDNSADLWGRLTLLASTFPASTLLYIELPSGENCPRVSGGDEPISPRVDNGTPEGKCSDSGGAWLREAVKRFPNFVGVFHEWGDPEDVAGNAKHINAAHDWFRDVQEIQGETDTYWKFWENRSDAEQRAYNDGIARAFPWLHGCLSGCSTHPAPVTTSGSGGMLGTLAIDQVTPANAPDFRAWAQTTTIEAITIGLTDLSVQFDKQSTWPEDSFGVQYSIGLCLNRGGWICSAPIELWKGKPGGGGPIQNQAACPDKGYQGQVACNWFYDGRWAALRGQQPQPGETIAVFVLQGDARNNVSTLHERSDFALVALPMPNEEKTFRK